MIINVDNNVFQETILWQFS